MLKLRMIHTNPHFICLNKQEILFFSIPDYYNNN